MGAIYAIIIGLLAIECWNRDYLFVLYLVLAFYVGSYLRLIIDGGNNVVHK